MEDFTNDVKGKLNDLGWSFIEANSKGDQWIFDVGHGQMHYEGGEEWKKDLEEAILACE